MSFVTVRRAAQAIQPNVTFGWDADCSTVSCDVQYPVATTENRKLLRDELDQQFNIRVHGYILTGGMFSMALDCQKRVKDWDIYTNPARWTNCTFPFVEAIPATLHIDAQFDETGRCESMGEPAAFHEPGRGTLYLSWGEVSTWYAIAPALALGVANDNTLAQIRLDGLIIEEAKEGRTGLLARIGRSLGRHNR